MKIVIWGVGERGKRIFSRLKENEVVSSTFCNKL